ncbi:GvpL/GvpF family gas vesicle protein [Janibacter cremeus]|uniref:GvpL/GvpF family gas vesicle protein n=1 Tax=Janibacter cremeus TaxID=1285192 RepID=UPI0023FA3114|nr:GvpL/GvpF family gas vesicle protein [Janibacter cremeus]WEV78834.1 GvpL/GvpF family gas vesicle protein [Janibacter cremeus]
MTVETTRGFYAYGIVPSSRTDLPETGMGFDEPHLAAVGPVAVVGEWVDLQANLAKKRHLTAHTDLLNRLAQNGPVLPLQFGSILADDGQAVVDLFGADPGWYADRLAELEGLSQYVLRAQYDLDETLAQLVDSDPEIAHLRERTRGRPEEERHDERVRLGELVSQAMEARRGRDAEWVRSRIEPYVAAVAPRDVGGLDGLAELALALSTDQLADFEAAAEELAEQAHPWARVSLVGPMAMYDFVPTD